MPQLQSKEVKEICFSNLRKYFDGQITKDELDKTVNEVERQMALGEAPALGLFDLSESPKGGS